MHQMEIHFNKKGVEIKEAIQSRLQALESRLDRRNQALSKVIADPQKIRSYIIRHSGDEYFRGHGRYGGAPPLYSDDHISSEEVEEIAQLCRRIFEIEQEINNLKMVHTHLDSDEDFKLTQAELASYGFAIDR